MSGERILVVDDEAEILRCLRPALTACGYEVLSAESGKEALRAIAARAPDVVLLDLGLPDMDGKEVIAQAGAFSKTPILVLSARDREAEKIMALDAGAVDYVEKPFAIGELMARLRAALRHASRDGVKVERIERGDLVIDLGRRLVARAGMPIKLTPKEYDLLAHLARGEGRLLTHRQLLSAVWGPAHVDDSQYLRVFIGQLRAKIEEDPANPKLILTELGAGYRFAEAGL
ncbi:response regulator [Methylocystis heyeri]|uniref:Response regulator n=1 Tax=Methylocystis heyeri TaxID=391905 RepID=A0A6B8KJW5_9HYPH|nr:response regulator transcription factor [Methylocystis heyeri]QGM46900.1 response regulator [Methylocystis heyeri]